MRRQQLMVTAAPLPATNETLALKSKPMKLVNYMRDAFLNGAYAKVTPYLQSVNKRQGETGSQGTDKVFAAIEFKKYGQENNMAMLAEASIAEIVSKINWALRGIVDEHGNRIDQNTRRALALAAPATQAEAADWSPAGAE